MEMLMYSVYCTNHIYGTDHIYVCVCVCVCVCIYIYIYIKHSSIICFDICVPFLQSIKLPIKIHWI